MCRITSMSVSVWALKQVIRQRLWCSNIIRRRMKRISLLLVWASFLFWVKSYILDSLNVTNVHDYNKKTICDGEQMAYEAFSRRSWLFSDPVAMSTGIKFDCKHNAILKRLNLSDDNAISVQDDTTIRFPGDVVFVFAANAEYYDSLRAVIHSTQTTMRYSYEKLIVYDLGGIERNATMMNELRNVCKLEFRRFDFSQLPAEIRDLKTYSWKLFILAEIFSQHKAVIYCDTSVYLTENDFDEYFYWMSIKRHADFQLTKNAKRYLIAATNFETFGYLPLDSSLNAEEVEMMKTSVVIFRRSEFTRQILKWAVLCALTKECIDPNPGMSQCKSHQTEREISPSCLGRDESILSILLSNAERDILNKNSKFIPHSAYNHRSKYRERYVNIHGQTIDAEIDTCSSREKIESIVGGAHSNVIFEEMCESVAKSFHIY